MNNHHKNNHNFQLIKGVEKSFWLGVTKTCIIRFYIDKDPTNIIKDISNSIGNDIAHLHTHGLCPKTIDKIFKTIREQTYGQLNNYRTYTKDDKPTLLALSAIGLGK